MRIYLASSWRNQYYPIVLGALRYQGHDVYDFRNPDSCFRWADIDPMYESWSTEQYAQALQHPLAKAGFTHDMRALEQCEACVLLLPCGRSAHLEAGWAKGAGRKLYVCIPERQEPDLMYMMADGITKDLRALVAMLGCAAAEKSGVSVSPVDGEATTRAVSTASRPPSHRAVSGETAAEPDAEEGS